MKGFLAFSVLLFFLFSNSVCADVAITQKTNEDICRLALTTMGDWENIRPFKSYANEARRRGYTPEQCAALLERLPSQIANSNFSSSLAMPDKEVCNKAIIKANGVIIWDNSLNYARYVREAIKRGYTFEQCATLTGRGPTLAAQEAEKKRKAQIAAQQAEKKRKAELAAQEADKKRKAHIAAHEAEKKRKAQIAAQEAEKKRLNEIVPVSSGSGFAVSLNGHVVTNNHVIDGCTYVKIHHKGKAIRSTVLYRDPINDLAVLQGDFVPSRVFTISRRNPTIMQEIFVAGYPFGYKISSAVKVTKGIVSSLTGFGNNVSNIQIDAAIQPGNSGGPIFDDRGNVIGVVVAKLALKGVIPENTNFGVKSTVVVNLLESNGISFQEANRTLLSNTELGNLMSEATYYLSCWMTMAQAREMATSKVMFRDLTK